MALWTTRTELAETAELLVNSRAGSRVGIPRPTTDALIDLITPWIGRFRPLVTTAALDGTGSAYSFALPSGWVAGFSVLREVEYPTGSQERDILDTGEWVLYPSVEAATHIRFTVTTPALGTGNIVLVYTVPHVVSDTAALTTVPAHEKPAYVFALAGELCKVRATEYGNTHDGTLEADAVDYGGKSNDWKGLAEMFFGQASSVLGIDLLAVGSGFSDGGSGGAGASAAGPAGQWHEWDPDTRFGGPIQRSRFGRYGR